MIRPAAFGYNADTAGSNAFQEQTTLVAEDVQRRAVAEFDGVVAALKNARVEIVVFDDTPEPPKPDAVFPNNWVSFHPDGTVILYPMHAASRRSERRKDIIEALSVEFVINKIIDLSGYETHDRFLEGTGSIVFDHDNRLAYACLSPRTDEGLLAMVCERLGYTPSSFRANDRNGNPIYHTNVMMCIADRFAVVCLGSITDARERQAVAGALISSDRELVDISFDQMSNFGGNMLALKSGNGHDLLVLSKRAYECLTIEQREIIGRHCEMLPFAIDTIETVGGGSARCMIAELFLPKRSKALPA